jgi:hypothetical protein
MMSMRLAQDGGTGVKGRRNSECGRRKGVRGNGGTEGRGERDLEIVTSDK